MSELSTFFAMNGYGFYVWSAYGVAALALAIELLALRSRRKLVVLEARLARTDDLGDAIGAAE
jgi:heme exporter protein CcmD